MARDRIIWGDGMTYEEAKYPCEGCYKSWCYQNCDKYNEWKNLAIEALEIMNKIGSTNHICLHCKNNRYGCCETVNVINCPSGGFEEFKVGDENGN